MTTLTYMDFQGSVKFEDGKLVIQVLHVDDTLLTECDSASEAPAAFQKLVDDYVEVCKEVGKEPARPFKGSFNVRMAPELHKRAAMAAASNDTSLNAWVVEAIERRLDRETSTPAAIQKMASTYARMTRDKRQPWQGNPLPNQPSGKKVMVGEERVSATIFSVLARHEQKAV